MLILFLVVMLSSCTTPSSTQYNNQLQDWVGLSQETLYYGWGEPNSITYITPNEKIVSYIDIDESAIGGDTQPYAGNEVYYPAISQGPNVGFPSQQNTVYDCKTSFTIINNQVTDYTFNGDDCVAEN